MNILGMEKVNPVHLYDMETSNSLDAGMSKPRHDPGNNDVQDCLQKNLAWVSKIA
jgi:hypothetical protein